MMRLRTVSTLLLVLLAACAKPATCSEFLDCARGCADRECLEDCGSELTATAQQALARLGACIDHHRCESDGCVEGQCGSEYAACLDGDREAELPGGHDPLPPPDAHPAPPPAPAPAPGPTPPGGGGG